MANRTWTRFISEKHSIICSPCENVIAASNSYLNCDLTKFSGPNLTESTNFSIEIGFQMSYLYALSFVIMKYNVTP